MTTTVAIGGMGGSGTRCIAQILLDWRFFMGSELNESLDNIHFTRLFKNPDWFKSASAEEKKKRIDLFFKLCARKKLTQVEREYFESASSENSLHPYEPERIKAALKHKWFTQEPKLRGWKEPNTHLYVEHLLNEYSDLKYIHVVRHGFDVALSQNKQQLQNWRFLFHIDSNQSQRDQQFEFWYKSTQRILSLQEIYPNLYVINMDALNSQPKEELKKLSEFIGKAFPIEKVLPRVVEQKRKYSDPHVFSSHQIEQLTSLGFTP